MCYALTVTVQFSPPQPPTRQGAPLQALPTLLAPVWGQQPDETPEAFRAFVGGLQGGPSAFDLTKGGLPQGQGWELATRASGFPLTLLKQLAERWAWSTRAREYWTHVRTIAYDAAQPFRDQLTGMQAQRARTHQVALDLEELELRKLWLMAKGENPQQGAPEACAPQLDVRALARLRQVNAAVSEQLRREAQGIDPTQAVGEGGEEFDPSKLSDDEAEEYRRLRDKAGG
jgi:hypothetical protein